MNIQQLRYICTLVKCGFSVSRCAALLQTSQPAVSQQIRALEDELRVRLFVRDRHRLVALTAAGQEILARAETALAEIDAIRRVASGESAGQQQRLVIATTHLQARYVLPTVLKAFAESHPTIELVLVHGEAAEIAQHLVSGTAQIGVLQATRPPAPDVVILEARRFPRAVVVPPRHPLLRVKPLTLEAIAKYPLITYGRSSEARQQVFRTFKEAGLSPQVILDATDADVMKACVARELGIAILPDIAVTAADRADVRTIDARHLFPASVTAVAIHRRHYLGRHAWDFVELVAPRWKRGEIEDLRTSADA